jgi:hypothetical protein
LCHFFSGESYAPVEVCYQNTITQHMPSQCWFSTTLTHLQYCWWR